MKAQYQRRCRKCGFYVHVDETVQIKDGPTPNARRWWCLDCYEGKTKGKL